jgi:NAD(P)-dependent dehydrogenase (short-subunit alcohol dehydrogenase family)
MKRNIVITGGAQGIGKLTSLHLLEAGYGVIVWDNDPEAIAEMQEAYQHAFLHVMNVDVANEQAVSAAVNLLLEKFGNIDGLVNNAMVSVNKPIQELTLAEWNRVLAVNLTGPFLCVKHLADALKNSRGAVVNICSTRALQSEPNTEAYSATKGGLLAMTHALAMSLGPAVRVNAVSPGWIDVSAVRKKSQAKQYPLSVADHAQHPVGRVGKAQDIANMIEFLLRPDNDFITGQNFIVDGGMTKKMIYVE